MSSQFSGINPAFYACYDADGNVSAERTEALALHLLNEGVQGEMLTKAKMRSVNRDTSDNRKIVVTAGTLMETDGYTGSGTVVTLQYRAKKNAFGNRTAKRLYLYADAGKYSEMGKRKIARSTGDPYLCL